MWNREGWICPVCHRVNSPDKEQCCKADGDEGTPIYHPDIVPIPRPRDMDPITGAWR